MESFPPWACVVPHYVQFSFYDQFVFDSIVYLWIFFRYVDFMMAVFHRHCSHTMTWPSDFFTMSILMKIDPKTLKWCAYKFSRKRIHVVLAFSTAYLKVAPFILLCSIELSHLFLFCGNLCIALVSIGFSDDHKFLRWNAKQITFTIEMESLWLCPVWVCQYTQPSIKTGHFYDGRLQINVNQIIRGFYNFLIHSSPIIFISHHKTSGL